MITVIATGGFDPIHSGHIEYLKDASNCGTRLVVGVNSDDWLKRKKGRYFMPWEERAAIVKELTCVDEVISFDDSDDTAINAIEKAKKLFPHDVFVFVNGGDRTSENIPEMSAPAAEGVEFEFGVGGENKANSSSWILKEWSQPTVQRAWGTYTVLDANGTWQVKELSFDAGKSLSDQRHAERSEHWHVVSGSILMELDYGMRRTEAKVYWPGQSIDIPKGVWHKATNVGTEPAKVIEVWLGDNLSEDDIERRD